MIRSKVFLVLLGVFLSLVATELTLRAGGALLEAVQEYKNQQSISAKPSYKILALGESTTAPGVGEDHSWPKQLETILNSRFSPKTFAVINKGVNSATSQVILSHLAANIDEYAPDIVVGMIGVNDAYGTVMYASEFIPGDVRATTDIVSFVRSFRLYKLYKLIGVFVAKFIENHFIISAYEVADDKADVVDQKDRELHLLNKIQQGRADDKDYHALGIIYFTTDRVAQSEELFQKALLVNPKNIESLMYLGSVYLRTGRRPEAERLFQQAIETNPQSALGYSYLADMYANYFERDTTSESDTAKAEQLYKKAIEVAPKDDIAYRKLVVFYIQKEQYKQAEQVLRALLAVRPTEASVYMQLGDLYATMGQSDEAQSAYAAAQQFLPSVKRNYQLIVDEIVRRGIPFVAVQYPTRSVVPLKMLLGESAKNNVYIVDNEIVFKNAVKSSSYDDYFIDRFAGDFGHATKKGDELLAKTIADVIASKVLQQQK